MNREKLGRRGWGEAVSKLLPGDHIHYVAPANRAPAVNGLSSAGLDAQEAAQLKRMRKLNRRKKP